VKRGFEVTVLLGLDQRLGFGGKFKHGWLEMVRLTINKSALMGVS
jgi:hypothetical protein